MSVFSIAFVMVYKREDGTLIVAPYMARAATSSFDDEELTVDSVKVRFAETDFAKEGWSLLGEPVLSELDWQYVDMHKMQIRLEPHGKTVDVNPKLTKAAHLKSVT